MRANKVMGSASRADLVRQRRSQRSQQRISKTRQAARQPASSQPVIVRGGHPSAARPLKNSTQSRVRRQYYYALGTNGAEVRLPAISFIRPDWRILSGGLAICLILALYALLTAPQFKVQEFDIQGIQRLTPGDIDAVLGLKDSQIIEFNSIEAKSKLAAAFPELKDINISIGIPANVLIQVSERAPVISWNTQDTSYWIDAEGFILPPRGEVTDLMQISTNGLPMLLPLTESASPSTEANSEEVIDPSSTSSSVSVWGRQINQEIVNTMVDLQARIPAESSLVYNTALGLGWKDSRGWDVFIGQDLNNFDLKLTMYLEIIAQLEQQGNLPGQLVSVEYINAPFFK